MARNGLKTLIAATASAAIAPTAGAVTLNDSLSLNELLSAPAGAYSGSFSVANLLGQNGLAGARIESAFVAAYGYSDALFTSSNTAYSRTLINSYSYYAYLGGGYTYSYRCGWSTCYSYVPPQYGYALVNIYNDVTTFSRRDELVDKMTISADGQSASDETERSGDTTRTATGYNSVSNGTYGYDGIYSYTDDVYDAYAGPLQAGFGLDAAALMDLAQSGELDFVITADRGAFRLTSVQVTLEVDPAAVPEPATGALMLAGLAALAAAARRKGRRAEA